MGEFFGSIYCWFEDFFGLELAEYMCDHPLHSHKTILSSELDSPCLALASQWC